jgi:hypothetical protein
MLKPKKSNKYRYWKFNLTANAGLDYTVPKVRHMLTGTGTDANDVFFDLQLGTV